MRGSVHKKGSAYYIVFDQGRDPETGKRKQKWIKTGATKKKDAELLLIEMLKEINDGSYADPTKLTLAEYLEKWLQDYALTKVRKSTYDSYQWAVRRHLSPGLGTIPLISLKPLHIEEFLNKKSASNLSSTSVRYLYSVLNLSLGQAMKWQILKTNSCQYIDPPRKEKYNAQVFTAPQIQILQTITENTPLHLPVLLAATCGLRRGEVCGLRWQDTDLERDLLMIRHSLDWEDGKLTLQSVKTSNSERAVKLPQVTAAVFRAEKRRQAEDKLRAGGLYQDQDYVWAWDDGRPHDPDFLYKKFRAALKKHNAATDADEKMTAAQKSAMKLPLIRFHDLRHSHATYLLMMKVPTKVISERLGHSSINITQDIYSHVLPEMQEQAASEMDKLMNRDQIKKHCPKCNEPLSPTVNFCPNCGKKVQNAKQNKAE